MNKTIAISALISLLILTSICLAGECKPVIAKITEGDALRFSTSVPMLSDVFFDDIMCAAIWRENQCAVNQMDFDAGATTYDYNTGEEIEFSMSWFVKDSGIQTPNETGLIAFSDEESAREFVTKSGTGEAISFDDLVALLEELP